VRRKLLGNLALATVSTLVVPLAAELYLRLSGYAPPRFRDTARVANGRRTIMLDCYPENPRGYFDIDLRDPDTLEHYLGLGLARAKAVAPRAPHGVEFRYNSHRFRDVEWGPVPAGMRRVAVLGDSFTEGWGVKETDTYPRRLEHLLNAVEPGRWQVLNGGRRGADFPELFDMFEALEAFDADVVVYGMVLNDAYRSKEYEARQPYLNDWILDQGQMMGGRPVPAMGPLRSRLATFVEDRVETYRIGRASTRWYREMYAEPNAEGWHRTRGLLAEMNRRVRTRGGRFLLALWPLLVDLGPGYPFVEAHQTIGAFCLEAGIPAVDLLEVLGSSAAESLWVHPVDRHPNAGAHQRVAECLAPAVRDLAGD
jgi:lysophospholipase L1-like esterase